MEGCEKQQHRRKGRPEHGRMDGTTVWKDVQDHSMEGGKDQRMEGLEGTQSERMERTKAWNDE